MTDVSRNLRDCFLAKIPRILKVEVGFKPYSFRNLLLKYRELFFYKLIMTEVPINLRNMFLAKIPASWKVEVGIISDKKSSSQNG